jgi:methylated-DNA-protein-cysteine methyltransferase-like protein
MNDYRRYRKWLVGSPNSGRGQRSIREKIYQVVVEVPHGQVATYGQIAGIVGCSPREVGYAMAALPFRSEIPWQRVINQHGKISVRSDGQPDAEQRRQLQKEGVVFDARGVIDLTTYRWHGPSLASRARYGFDSLQLDQVSTRLPPD